MLRVEDQDADQDELRDDELDPEEALVTVGPVEDLLRDPVELDVGEREVARHDAVPEPPRGRDPDAGEDKQEDDAERRAPPAQTAASNDSGPGSHACSGSDSGSAGGRSEGLAYG